MKVIFLDIDGVLNSKEFLNNNSSEFINRNNVKILKNIIDKTEAKVIMSSGWKLWFDDKMMPKEKYSKQLQDILDEYGITLLSKTPDFITEKMRASRTFSLVKAREILSWLNEHKNVEKYVVLDDLDLNNEEINLHLVRINGDKGLTEEDEMRVIDMIN